MPWSTRELAEMASTTVNTIRHYHQLGLLEEPTRRYNGYKQYEVGHLVRLLRIRRLAGLGVPLSRMRELEVEPAGAEELLRALHDELRVRIEGLRSAQADIEELLRHGAPADSPAGFESVAARLSERDSSVVHIASQFYDDDALADVRAMAAEGIDGAAADLDRLPADADEEAMRDLVERLATSLARDLLDYPWLSDPAARLSATGAVNARPFLDAMTALYNPAQLDVMRRAHALADERVRAVRNPPASLEE